MGVMLMAVDEAVEYVPAVTAAAAVEDCRTC